MINKVLKLSIKKFILYIIFLSKYQYFLYKIFYIILQKNILL